MIIVDDDAFIREQLCEIFDWRKMGFIVIGCFGGADEAIKFMEGNLVDVLFSDIRLGGATGLDLAKRAHELYPNIEIVLISAYNEFEYAHDALRLSVFDYLQKPVTYNDVSECFAKLRQKMNIASNRTDNVIKYIQQCIDKLDHDNAYLLTKLYLREAGDDTEDARRLLLKLHGAFAGEGEEEEEEAKDKGQSSEAWANIRAKIFGAAGISEFNALAADIVRQAIISGAEYDYRQIELAKKYIAEHYCTNVSLEDTASYISMNPAYLSRYFKKHTGERFVDYLSQVRIAKAKALLADPSYKIHDIYEMVGYNSKHHFYNVFKKYTGTTPTVYRNHIQVDDEPRQ